MTQLLVLKLILMRIAIIGYGKMGKEIEIAALSRGHEIILKADRENQDKPEYDSLSKADVALEFSTPDSAFENITTCFNAGVPVVCGTTGWTARLAEAEQLCREKNLAFFYASNFSIGVNIMFRLNRWLAGLMNKFPDYEIQISEIHHIHKKDAPSGTAITLAEDILKKIDRKTGWKNQESDNPGTLSVISERTGEVPGTHIVSFKSDHDTLEINHQAMDRSVFASGAVLAAEYLSGKKGIFRMEDLLEL